MIKCENCAKRYDYDGHQIDTKGNQINAEEGNRYVRKRIRGHLLRTTKCICGQVVILEKPSIDTKIINIKMEEEDERTKELSKFFEHVYKCSKCSKNYGADKVEKKPYLCPFCEGKFQY